MKVELNEQEQALLQNLVAQVTQARATAYTKDAELKAAQTALSETVSRLETAIAVIAQLHGFTGNVQLSPDGRVLTGD